MGHFTIQVNGKRVGSVLSLATNELYACFNRNYPQYHDVWGSKERVRNDLRRQCPNAKYEPLSLPNFDALNDLYYGRMTDQQFKERFWPSEMDGLQNT